MKQVELRVADPWGMHARLAYKFAKTSLGFNSSVKIKRKNASGNGKDVLDILALAAGPGDAITILTDGEDENEALAILASLVRSG